MASRKHPSGSRPADRPDPGAKDGQGAGDGSARKERTRGQAPSRPSSRASGRVTLDDVSRLTGVSPTTISRVLNRPELVNPETLEHVRAVIARTGYVPNSLAGGLASRKSGIVAAIVPSLGNSMFSETVEALTDRLSDAGYKVLLGLTKYSLEREDELLSTVLSQCPEAVFLTGITHSPDTRRRLLAARVPVVETWDLTPTPIDTLIGFSHEKVGETVADHLFAKGYGRFAVVAASDTRAAARRDGFVARLDRHGVGGVASRIVGTPGTLRLGREGLASLLDGGERPEAVFCSSDAIAHGVLTEARARGLSVPGDLAVVGFGDLEFAPYTHPALSTVRIDRRGIGLRAAEVMLARFAGRTVEAVVDVGFALIERDSA